MSDSEEEQLMPTPSEFGRFILERELGHGGMGGVYLARDKVLDRQVALKVMLKSLGSDEKFMQRFKVEAQAAAKLIHPSIAQIYSYDIQDGQPYIAMEMVGGGSLMKLMEVHPGSTDVTRVMRIGKQIAEALSCAADQGLVHGDVKPENILFDANGNAKLVDFGLAGMQKTEDPDEIWGTPYYIAPEKVEKKTVDFRADMYSLGATLYHALTGVAPFEGADAMEVVRARFQRDAKKPSEVRADLPAGIDAIVMKMLARDPAGRYPTYEALLGDIGRFLSGNLTSAQAESLSPTATGSAPAPAAPAAAAPAAPGKKVLKIGGKKKIMLKPAKGGAAASPADAPAEPESEGDAEVADEEETPKAGGKKLKKKMRKANLDSGAEEAKEEMGLGKMVLLAILGVILVVGGVGGGLAWYLVSTKNQERAEKLRGYVTQQEAARAAIKQHAKNAQHFRDEFGEKRKVAFETVEKATNQYLELLEGDIREAVKAVIVPPESPELLEAIAYTNQIAEAKAAALAAAEAAANTNAAPAEAAAPAATDTNAPPAAAAAPADTNAAPAAAEAPKAAEKEVDKDAEAEAALAKAEKGEKEDAKPEEKAEAKDEAAAPEAPAEPEKPAVQIPEVVAQFQALWNDYYTILAADIRIDAMLQQVLEIAAKADGMTATGGKTDEELDAQKELMNDLAKLSNDVGDLVTKMKELKIVDQALKRSGSLKSKAPQLVKDTSLKIARAKAKAAKEAQEKAEAEAAAEKKRQAEEAHKKLAAEECEKARAKYTALSTTLLKHLAWDLGLKQMYAITNDFSTREGVAEAKMQAQQIERMRDCHRFFVTKGKGFKFRRGDTIKDVDEKAIQIQKYKIERGKQVPADVKKIDWERFYKENHGMLNELIIGLLEKGRDTTRVGKMEWSNNMLGAALTMRTLFSDDPAVPKRIEDIVKKAVKDFPSCRRYAEKYFPEIKLESGEEEGE